MARRSVATRKEALKALGPMLPGSISTQWNVCGKPGCRCKDPDRPRRHGPYYQLSFSVGGRSSTMFFKREELAAVRECLRRYRRFKELSTQLVAAYVEQARRVGVTALPEERG
jgi:hypothetical protein